MEGFKKSVVMKVEKINYNTYFNKPPQVGKIRCGGQTNFTGHVPQKDLIKELKNIIPYPMKVISRLAESMGEVQNIIINSLGTGLVAPLFIKYNPLSKTDEDTRTYSAWRQPISAILAVATQAGMVAPFNSIISDMSYSGKYPEEYNLSNFRDEKYLKKMIKKAEPYLTKDQIAKKVQETMTAQHKELLNNLRYKNKIMILTENGPAKQLSDKTYYNTMLDTIKALIKSDKAKEESCNTKETRRLIRSEFLSKNNAAVKETLGEIKQELDNAKNLNSMKSYLKLKYKQLKKDKCDSKLLEMVNELRARIKNVNDPPAENGKPVIHTDDIIMEELREKTDKMLKHAEKYGTITDENLIKAEVEKSVAERKDAFKVSLKTLQDLEKRITNGEKITVSEIEQLFKEKAKGISFKDSALHTEFAEELIDKYKNNIKNNIKGHKQFTGLIISLAVLPITCTLLNWVYPRFMDAVFPNLSNKKHDNESKQLVDKAPKEQTGGVAA